MRFLRLSDKQDEASPIHSFRSWVRKQARARRKPAAKKARRPRQQ